MTFDEFRELLILVCRVLPCDTLRLKPREKQFVLLLALESFGEGSDSGPVGVSCPVQGVKQTGRWCALLSDWRPSEIYEMLSIWRRAGWVAVDETEGKFRLAPDRLPGWADSIRLLTAQAVQPGVLPFATDEDINKGVAKISQLNARLPQSPVAKISQSPPLGGPGGLGPKGPNETDPETFKRLTSERLNVERSEPDCEIFAIRLMQRVRGFVGERDWTSEHFWNSGKGWRRDLFIDEGKLLESALNFCEAGLKTGETHLRKTRGAMLWNEFQRRRQESISKPH